MIGFQKKNRDQNEWSMVSVVELRVGKVFMAPWGLKFPEVLWAHASLVEYMGSLGNESIRHTILPEKHSLLMYKNRVA
jgi:hypothetical protein